MIEFKIKLPHNDGMTKQDRLDLFDFIDELKGEDLKFLLDGGHIKPLGHAGPAGSIKIVTPMLVTSLCCGFFDRLLIIPNLPMARLGHGQGGEDSRAS